MFVSIGLRFKAEVEALNMAENIGNYVRHRTVPIIVHEKDQQGNIIGYKITMAPGVSGQSIAYGYMKSLVLLAPKYKLPVCQECQNYESIGGFFKRAEDVNLTHDQRIKECVVEDLTGFMATKEKTQQQKGKMLRRTSPVSFSYLIPDVTSARGVVLPELHVRYNLQNPDQQAIFQIEAGTAIYIHGVAIDIDRIGTTLENKSLDDRNERIALAFDALKVLYGGLLFGAKKARYNPLFEPLGGVAAFSDSLPFIVTPPRFTDYVKENVQRAEKYNMGKIRIYCFDREGFTSCGKLNGITSKNTLEEMIDAIKEDVLKQLGESKQ
jgi:CRISPR-associated protein Csa2